jgi:hypothetical protein
MQGAIRLMARKLKTYQTSLGFFEQAIAAPSMKAALEAWGADSNLFHQGAAKESRDPDVIAATMAKPGVVLKRPVGSSGPFKEHAELPRDIAGDGGAKIRATARLGAAGRKGMRRRPSTMRRIARPRSRSRRSGSGESANAPRRRRLNGKSASGGRRLSIGLKPPWIPPAGSMTGTPPTFKPSWKLSKNGRGPKKRDGKRNDPNSKRCSGGPVGRRPAVETRQISSCSSLIGSFRSR